MANLTRGTSYEDQLYGFKVYSELHLKDLLGSLLHARPNLVAETPQCVELQDGIDALTGFLVM